MKTEENKSIKNGFDRQVMEEVSAEEYNLLRTLIDNMPDYIFVKDTQSRFLLSNKAHVRALGTSSQEELWGKNDFDIFPQELAAQYYADEQQVIQSGQALIDREELYVDPTGNWRWLSTTKVPLRDNEGNIIGLVGISRDITERKQMEATLAEERNLLRVLVDNMPDFIYIKDTHSRFLLANEPVRRHLGAATLDEVIGKTDFDFSPRELAEQYYADEQNLFRTGQPLILHEEPIFDHETDTTRWVLTIKVPFYNSQDQIAGLVGMGRDITKLKQTEQSLRYAHDELEMRVLQRTADLVKANEELQAEINERKQVEQALRASEERLRRVVQNMPVMMNALDEDRNIIVWNRECERVTGYSVEEIVGNPQAMKLLYPNDDYRRRMVDEWDERGNNYRNWEWELTSKDGRTKTIAWSNISQQFPIPGWAAWAVGVDVTKRQRVEEALRHSEQRYKQLLSSVTDYIYTVHIDHNQVVGTTHGPNCVAVTGYTSEEYQADPNLWYQMIYEEDRPAVIEQAGTLLNGQAVAPLDHRIIHKDGSVRWVRNTPVLRKDEYNHVISYDGLITDITARKLAEEALRQSESRYRLLMEHASDGIIILNQYGNLLKVNSKTAEMLRYPREQLLSFKIEDLIPPEELVTTPLAFDELRAGNTVLRERHLRRYDGSLIPVEISAKMIESDRILSILRDISERKAVERREKVAYDLGRQLTTLLDRDALLYETVNRIKETFGYYYVHVYLVEDSYPKTGSRGRLLVVREGTGEPGQTLKQQAHTIPLKAERSLVAQAARSFEPVVANDISQNPDHLPNPFLPKTRSEVAIPLFLGSRLIGVLDVQHTTINRFTPDEVRTLQIIASQLSVALANAELFAESARRLAIIENSSDLIALFNLDDGFIIDINPAGVKLLGFSQPEHVIYIPLSSFYSPEGLHRVEDEGIPTTLRQGVWRGENLICQVDGTCIPVSQTIFVIDNKQGEPTVLATIMSDITKRKQAEEEQQRLFEEVKAGRERLQILSHRLVEVQEAERRHIARELHDEVGQLLTGLKLTLEMTANLPDETIGSNLKEAQILVNELIAQVRELSLELRPAMLDDLGLLPTLLWHFERYSNQTKIQVNFNHAGLERRFTSAVETAAYRIVQEALTNAARYAGVRQVMVQLWVDQETLNLQIEDQGVGFDFEATQAAGESSGLSGMSERAVLLGGQVIIESSWGSGTRVTARLPINMLTESDF